MLKLMERRIILQLLVFYCLFVIPLLLGGIELYFYQRDSLQQSARQADMNLAQVISFDIASSIQGSGNSGGELAPGQAEKLRTRLIASRQQLTHGGDAQIWLLNQDGRTLVSIG